MIAIAAVLTAMAVPSWRQMRADQELRMVTREVATLFNTARTQALATGQNHLVFIGAGGGPLVDACGNPLVDVQGNPVPMLIANDGAPGTGNCCFNDGLNERVDSIAIVPGVNWGATFGVGVAANLDNGGGNHLTGSSFNRPDGLTQANWLMFRPDGIPVAFDPACNAGTTGTGNGGVYVTNGNRDYGVVVSPLGTVVVQRYERGANLWQ